MQATPKKLKNGNWGALVKTERVGAGDVVTITTKSGKSWQAEVEHVLWKGKGVAICATANIERHGGRGGGRGGGRRTGCACGSREDQYGDLIPSPNNCWTCEHDA